ncbi:MAG: TIGR03560 family F420-dependent LLM class oxidoreductase [Candidatus Asgardarchaeia archaeon]
MGKLMFGIQIEPQFGFSYDDIVTIVKHAEKKGFHSVWFSDHFFLDDKAVNKNCFEAWTILTAIAVQTTRIRLGTLVTCQSYRYPSLLAKITSNVDVISNGRLEVGIGAGWKEIEYNAYGIPFPTASKRIKQMREAIIILKKMWTEDKATFEGEYYSIKDAINFPKPIQKPHPTVWVGGTGTKLLRVTAEVGDGLNFAWTLSPEKYKERLDVLKDYCAEMGRDFNKIRKSVGLITLIGENESALEAKIRKEAEKRKMTPEKYLEVRKGFLIGTPDEVVERLREYEKLGVELVIFMFPYGHEFESIDLIEKHIIPSFK